MFQISHEFTCASTDYFGFIGSSDPGIIGEIEFIFLWDHITKQAAVFIKLKMMRLPENGRLQIECGAEY